MPQVVTQACAASQHATWKQVACWSCLADLHAAPVRRREAMAALGRAAATAELLHAHQAACGNPTCESHGLHISAVHAQLMPLRPPDLIRSL